MKIDVILGLQWGDEGKGKIVDVLTPRYDIIARFQGGPNAGHTIIIDGVKHVLHTIPSGIFRSDKANVIGNGVIIDPYILFREIDALHQSGLTPEDNLFIAERAHLILPTHRLLDAALEWQKGATRIGSTLKGIGPTYTDKYGRIGLRVGNIFQSRFEMQYKSLRDRHLEQIEATGFDFSDHLLDGLRYVEYEERWFESVQRLRKLHVICGEQFINDSLDKGKTVLAEGAQGTMLDVDFGSYPFVTSSNTITAGVCSGLGVSPHRIGLVYGVFKAYCTRVGSGPFPTELQDEMGDRLRVGGNEFGSTTGRPRRCGWIDIPALRYSIMLNGVDRLIMMKTDVLSPFQEVQACIAYRKDGLEPGHFPFDLEAESFEPLYITLKGWNTTLDSTASFEEVPRELAEYVRFIEQEVNLPVDMISMGPDRSQILVRNTDQKN